MEAQEPVVASISIFGLSITNFILLILICVLVPILLYKMYSGASAPFSGSSVTPKGPPELVANVSYPYGVSEIQGRRNYMEDRHVEAGNLCGDPSKCFYGVFDGHGGSRASDFCIERVVPNLVAHAAFNSHPHQALIDSFLQTDKQFLERARRHKWDDGTTACGALFFGNRIMVANAGDTRAIVVQKHGNVVPLSFDHKPHRVDEKERIKKCGGAVFLVGVWRVEGILAVSRAIGDRVLKRYVTSRPDIEERTIAPSDKFLVIASDGLWDVMGNDEVGDFIHTMSDPQQAARSLVEYAYRRGSMDNITALVVDISHPRATSAERGAGMATKYDDVLASKQA